MTADLIAAALDTVPDSSPAFTARGPLYALTAYRLEKPREWRRQVDAPASTDFTRIRSILDEQGLTFLAATDLTGLAAGFVTEMDGVPASFFEVLFSEVA